MRSDQPPPPPSDRKERKVDRSGSVSGSSSGAASDSLASSSLVPRLRDQEHQRGASGFGARDSGRFDPRRPTPGQHHRSNTDNSPSRSNQFHSEDERKHTRDSNTSNHNTCARSPSNFSRRPPTSPDFSKRPQNGPPKFTAPRSLAIPISTSKPPPQPSQKDQTQGDASLGPLSWKPLKWPRSVSETDVKEAPAPSPVLSAPQPGDEVAASRKKARLGWGQGLAKYEKEKVQGSVESSGAGPSESGLNGPGVCASPATPVSALTRPLQVIEEKMCTTSTENNPSHQTAPEPKELRIDLDNINSNSVNSLSTLLSNLLQPEDSCTGDSTFLTKVSLLKIDISQELEKTENEIDSLELELKSLSPDPESNKSSESVLIPTPLPKPCEKLEVKVEELQQVEEPIKRGDDNNNTSTSSGGKCNEAMKYVDLIPSINASNEETIRLSRREVEKYAVAEPPEVNMWDLVKGSKILKRNEAKIREKLRVRKREVKFKERALALKFIALRKLWKEDLRLLDVKKNFTKSGKPDALSTVPVRDERNSVRSLLPPRDGASGLIPSKEILRFSSKLLSNTLPYKCKDYEIMPSLILDEKQKQNSIFPSQNGIIEDPVSYERNRSMINPWTEEEIEIFKEKLGTLGKEFSTISSFLDHKSTAECVEFYYKHRRSETFSGLRKNPLTKERLEQLKKHKPRYEFSMPSNLGRRSSHPNSPSPLDILGDVSLIAYNQINSRGKQKTSMTGTKSRTGGHGSFGKTVSSSEAVSSCLTSLTDPVIKLGQTGQGKMAVKKGLVEESEESCGDELVSPDWTDSEKSLFVQAYRSCGKDFVKISHCVGTRSRDECKVFFCKAQRSLGLDSSNEVVNNCMNAPVSPAGNATRDDFCVAEIDSGVCSLQSCSREVSKACESLVVLTDINNNDIVNDGSSELDSEMNEISKQDLNDRPVNEEQSNPNFGLDCIDVEKVDLEVKVEQSNPNFGLECIDVEKVDLEVKVEEKEHSVKKEAVPVVVLDDTGTDTDITVDKRTQLSGTGMLRERVSLPRPVAVQHQTGTARCRRRASIDLGTSNLISFALDPGTINENVPTRPPTFGTGYNSQLPLEIRPYMLKENQGNIRTVPVTVPIPFSQAMSTPISQTQTTLNFEDHLNKRAANKELLQPYMQKNPLTNQTNQMMHVLKGYPLQVQNHRRNEFIQHNQSFLSSNANNINCPGILFGSRREDLTRPVMNQVDPSETGRTGDVKLFGKILTQSKPSEKPISNENITKNVSPVSNLPPNHTNAFFPTHGNLGLDGLPVRSYGFWDGNRIQTGFSSLPESARIMAGVLPTNNMNLSTFQQPHMQHLVSNVRQIDGFGVGAGVGFLRPGNVVSDPVAALKLHFGSNKSNGVWNGEDVGR